MIGADSWQIIDNLTYKIHSANDLLSLRLIFLKEIDSLVPSDISFFDLKCKYRGKSIYFNPVSLNMSKSELEAYYSSLIEKDYTSWIVEQSQDYPVYRDSDFISESARRDSFLYKNWLEPMGVEYGCGISISFQGIDYGTATLARNEKHGDFSDLELSILSVTVKHLGLRFNQLFPYGIPYESPSEAKSILAERFRLTSRECELCGMLAEGMSTEEIATSMFITESTVNRHLHNIFEKTGVNNRVSLIKLLGKKRP